MQGGASLRLASKRLARAHPNIQRCLRAARAPLASKLTQPAPPRSWTSSPVSHAHSKGGTTMTLLLLTRSIKEPRGTGR
jgi:hypothetical protein